MDERGVQMGKQGWWSTGERGREGAWCDDEGACAMGGQVWAARLTRSWSATDAANAVAATSRASGVSEEKRALRS